MPRGSKIHRDVHYIVIRLSSLLKPADIAVYTGISQSSVEHILRYFALHGTIEDGTEGNPNTHLRDADVELLFGNIRQTPDVYIDELQETVSIICGQNVTQSTIWRKLCRRGFRLKKMTRVAAEHAAEKRLDYLSRISRYQANQLVFVDDSSADRRTTYRGHAWAIGGAQAQRTAFFVRGKRFSVLPALSLESGFLNCEVYEGAVRADTFSKFVLDLLENMQPFPGPNSVIVMDNCCIHKYSHIQDIIHARGMRCEFLPPYSADYNPIEHALSYMKDHLRREGDHIRLATTPMSYTEIYHCLLKALYTIPITDIRGWYKSCGYM